MLQNQPKQPNSQSDTIVTGNDTALTSFQGLKSKNVFLKTIVV